MSEESLFVEQIYKVSACADSIQNAAHQTSLRPLRGTWNEQKCLGALKIEFPPFGRKVSFLIDCFCSFIRWEKGWCN
ncbi:hypothetical protein CEXT_155981 [Caerostris extrusa]|uniref:Uncharacterized protein n=1 Tax=Caerostris extrusa TaxID=172846 RepID=A0AAV4Q8T8_CAEEX|nr:hypothetical protein CEXT_155981 [Caerostris extrusa]